MTIEVRAAAVSDDRALAELDAQSWPRELQVVPPNDATSPFFGERRLVQDVLVAVDDGAVLGYARLGRNIPIPANAHVLHLNAVAVSPDARGRGIGTLLVAATIDEARRRGARKLGLRALSINTRAIRLYETHGFVLEGRIAEEILLPDGTYADDLWYALRV